jgi:hypothetical protein
MPLKNNIGIHCNLGGSAWTDIITNQVSLSGFQNDVHLPVLTRGTLPISCLPAFLHESTHHWCSLSAVGNTLSFLELKNLLDLVGYKDNKDRILENHSRLIAAITILRPLAEGLAQFCEFDVFPAFTGSTYSEPMWWAYFFCRPSKEELQNTSRHGESVYNILGTARTSENLLNRKTNLLLHPMDNKEGGYLSGYLTVKRMWYEAARRSAEFSQTDFFFRFVRHYFYSDFGMVYTLLQEEVSKTDGVNSILAYFQVRLREFFALDFEAEAKKLLEFESRSPDKSDVNVLPVLGIQDELATSGRVLLDRLQRMLSIESPKSLAEGLIWAMQIMFAQKDLFCITRVPVTIVHRSDECFGAIYNDNEILRGPYQEGAPKSEGPGTVSFYISLIKQFSLCVLTKGVDQIYVGLNELSGPTGVSKEAARYFMDFAVYRDSIEAQRKLFDAFLRDNDLESLLTFVRIQSLRISSLAYLECALFDVPTHNLSKVYAMMQDHGLYNCLNKNMSLVEAAGCISLGAAVGYNTEKTINTFGKYVPSLKELIEQLAACWSNMGLVFYNEQNNRLVCLF